MAVTTVAVTKSKVPEKRKQGEGDESGKGKGKKKLEGGGTSQAVPPLAKHLASNEKAIRDRAVASLARFLSGSVEGENHAGTSLPQGQWEKPSTLPSRFNETEMLRLWQGIFYCFWMSDMPLVQQDLARTLSSLALQVCPVVPPSDEIPPPSKRKRVDTGSAREDESDDASSKKRRKTSRGDSSNVTNVDRFRAARSYLHGFWATIGKEWANIDRHRLDKYYLLIRFFLRYSLLLLRRERFAPQAVNEHNSLLLGTGGPLSSIDNPSIPPSLAYHLADIYVWELSLSLTLPLPDEPAPNKCQNLDLIILIQPFLEALARAPSKPFYSRVWEKVFEPLQAMFAAGSEEGLDVKNKPLAHLLNACVASASNGDSESVSIVERKPEDVWKGIMKALWDEASKVDTPGHNRRKMYAAVRECEEDGAEGEA